MDCSTRYVKHMVHDARQHGLRAVVFNSRGTSDGPVTTPQFYSASYTGDMRAVVTAVQRRWPRSALLAAGWSLGGALWPVVPKACQFFAPQDLL